MVVVICVLCFLFGSIAGAVLGCYMFSACRKRENYQSKRDPPKHKTPPKTNKEDEGDTYRHYSADAYVNMTRNSADKGTEILYSARKEELEGAKTIRDIRGEIPEDRNSHDSRRPTGSRVFQEDAEQSGHHHDGPDYKQPESHTRPESGQGRQPSGKRTAGAVRTSAGTNYDSGCLPTGPQNRRADGRPVEGTSHQPVRVTLSTTASVWTVKPKKELKKKSEN